MMTDKSEPTKVVGLFNRDHVSAPEQTSELMFSRLDRLRETFAERKIVAACAVGVDEEGRAYVMFAAETWKSTALLGAIEYARYQVAADMGEEMMQVPAPSPDGNDSSTKTD